MVRRLLLSAACAGTAFAGEAPTLTVQGPDVAFVSETEFIKFTASGGYTDPPSLLETGPWVRTGRRQYTWGVKIAEDGPNGTKVPHPLDGTVTSTVTLHVPQDRPGTYSVSVKLQEEWLDLSKPWVSIFWPLAKGERPPRFPKLGEFSPVRQTQPAPALSGFPFVPPLAAAESGK